MSSASSAPGSRSSAGREVSLVLASQLAILATGLATQSLLARLLAPEGRGAFAVCVMFGSMFGVLFAPGSDRAAQYFVMSGRHTLSRGVWLGLGLAAVGSLLAIVLALPLLSSPIAFFHKADASSFELALLLIPLLVMVTALQLQLAGLRRFGRLALVAAAQGIVHLLGIAALVWLLPLGVPGAVLALVAANAAALALLLSDLRRNAGLRFEQPSLAELREVLGYGRRYYVARVGSMIDLQVAGVFLALLATQAEIGLFSAATALILRAFLISESIEASLLPRVAADPDGRPELVGQCARLSALVTAPPLLALVALSVPIVRLLLSEAFLPCAALLWILSPGVLLYAASKVLMAYFRGRNRPEICSWVVWFGLCVNVAALLVLYPLIGLPAAAWAMTIGFAARSLLLAFVFSRVSGQGFRATWLPRRADLALLLGSARDLLGRLDPDANRVADA